MGLLEILLVALAISLIAGPRRLGKLFRSLGRGLTDFKTEFESLGKKRRSELEENQDGSKKKDPGTSDK